MIQANQTKSNKARLTLKPSWGKLVKTGELYQFKLSSPFPYKSNLNCQLEGCACRHNSFIWISHQLRAIYFETPKAACSSIKSALGIASGQKSAILRACAKQDVEVCGLTTKPFRESVLSAIEQEKTNIERHFSGLNGEVGRYGFRMLDLSPSEAVEAYPDYFSFGVVRDPLERLLSCWRMFCQSQSRFRNGQIHELFGKKAEEITWQRFVQYFDRHPNHHWEPYAKYFPVLNENVMLDFVGKQETLDADWRQICERLNINEPLPHHNQTRKNKGAYTFLNDAVKTKLAEYYAQDYRLFDYVMPDNKAKES